MLAEKKLLETFNIHAEPNTARVNSYDIHYIKVGKGDPIILLHGANMGLGQWFPNINELSKHFTVYALDLPGAGKSTKVDFHNIDLEKTYIDTVQKFIELHKLSNVSIVGHSLGGWIAVKVALKDPQYLKSIVLLSPIGFTKKVPHFHKPAAFYPIAKFLSKTALSPTEKGIRRFVDNVLHKKSLPHPKEFIAYLKESIDNNENSHPIFLINRLTHFKNVDKKLTIGEDLASIQLPVLIVLGENDPVIDTKYVAEKIPENIYINIETFKHVGHVPSLEKSDKFNKLVIKFILNNKDA